MDGKYSITAAVFVLLFLVSAFEYTKEAAISGDTLPLITNAFHTLKFDYVPTFPNRHPGFASEYFQQFVSLFGFDSIVEYRLLFIVAFSLAFLAVYLAGMEKGGLVALLAVFLFGMNIITAYNLEWAQNQSFAMVLQVVAIVSLYFGWEKNKRFLPLAAFFSAIALYNREEAAFLPLFFAVYLTVRERGLQWLRLKIVIISGVVYALSLLPLFIVHWGLREQNLGLFVTTFVLAKSQNPNPDVLYYLNTLPKIVPLPLLFFVAVSIWLFIRQRDVWRLFVLAWFSVFFMVVSSLPSRTLEYGFSFHPALFLLVADGFAEATKFLKVKSRFAELAAVFMFLALVFAGIYPSFKDASGNFAWPLTDVKDSEIVHVAEITNICPHAYLLGMITAMEYYVPTQAVNPGWISEDLDFVIEKTRPQLMVLDNGYAGKYADVLKKYELKERTEYFSVYVIEPYKCFYNYSKYSKFVIGRIDAQGRSYPAIWQWPKVLPWYTGRLQPYPVGVFMFSGNRTVDLASGSLVGMEGGVDRVAYEYSTGSLVIEQKGNSVIIYLRPKENVNAASVVVGERRIDYPGGIATGSLEKIAEVSFT